MTLSYDANADDNEVSTGVLDIAFPTAFNDDSTDSNDIEGFYAWADAEDTESALPPSSSLPHTLSNLIHHTLAGDVVHAAFDPVCHTAVPLRGGGGHHDAKQLVPDTTFSAFFHKSVVALASTQDIVGLHGASSAAYYIANPATFARERLPDHDADHSGQLASRTQVAIAWSLRSDDLHEEENEVLNALPNISVGTHVSKVLSVTPDQWTDDEINSMIEVGGNSYANAIYEALLPEDYEKPHPNSSQEERATKEPSQSYKRIPVMPSDGLPQVLGETEPSQSTNEGNNYPYTSQLTILEEHYAVSKERNIKCILEQVHVPEITDRSGGEFHQRSASAADPPTIELVLENAHQGSLEDAEQKDNCGDSMSNERQHHNFIQVRLDVLQHEYNKVDYWLFHFVRLLL
ncbi:hypothetical protein ACJX0J_042445, partial [Zea mays]